MTVTYSRTRHHDLERRARRLLREHKCVKFTEGEVNELYDLNVHMLEANMSRVDIGIGIYQTYAYERDILKMLVQVRKFRRKHEAIPPELLARFRKWQATTKT